MLLLPLVLLLRERVDAAELLPPTLEADELRLQLLPFALDRLGPRLCEASPRVRRLGVDPRELDLDSRRALARRRRLVPQVCLRRAEPPELSGELCRAARLRLRLRL